MKILTSVILLSLCSLSAFAAEPWSLDSCINYAVEHNINVRTSALNRLSGELSITEAKDAFLPQVSAGVSQSFNFGRGLTAENTYANRNTSQTGWNVGLQLPIFQGLSAIRRLDYQKANLRTLIEREEATKDDVTLNVISQYLQVLYCGEIHAVAIEQLRISNIELARRRALFEAGKIPELDITQAESQVAQDELSEVSARNDRTMALVDLAQLLQLPDIESFDIIPLPDTTMPLLSADDVYRHALNTNHGILAQQYAVDAADKNIDVARSGYIPRLSFNAGIGSSYYKLNGVDNPSFSRQMRDNLNKSIGFSLSIPIFDAFSTRNSIRRAKVEKLNASLQLENARLSMFKTIQQAYYQAVAADKKRTSSKTARKATHAALLAMQEKYNYGKANATEFEQAKSDYIRAASQAIQAKYESMLRLRILNFYNK